MSWDQTCPWGYESSYVDHMPSCTFGLGDGEYSHGKAAAAAAGQGLAPVGGRISEVMQVPAGGMDWTTIAIYGGIALLAITLLSKGGRRR